MSEILRYKGRLAEAEYALKKLRVRIRGLIMSIRDNLDPLAGVEEIDADIIADQSLQLADLKIRYTEILADIQAVKKVLGR